MVSYRKTYFSNGSDSHASKANVHLGLELRMLNVRLFPGELCQPFISKVKESKTVCNTITHEKTFVMGSLRSTRERIHKYHDNIVDAKCYLKNALLSKC